MKVIRLFPAAVLATAIAAGASVNELSDKKALTLDGARKVIAGAGAQAKCNQFPCSQFQSASVAIRPSSTSETRVSRADTRRRELLYARGNVRMS
jgi:hypothetical protein